MPSARPLPGGRASREKSRALPQRVKTEASRHHRVALEVAGKEPEIGLEIEHRADQSLAVFAARLGDFRNAVEHQHRRQRQLRALGRKARPARRPAGPRIRKFERRSCIRIPRPAPVPDCRRFPNIWGHGGKAAPRPGPCAGKSPPAACRGSCSRRRAAYNDFTCNDLLSALGICRTRRCSNDPVASKRFRAPPRRLRLPAPPISPAARGMT